MLGISLSGGSANAQVAPQPTAAELQNSDLIQITATEQQRQELLEIMKTLKIEIKDWKTFEAGQAPSRTFTAQ